MVFAGGTIDGCGPTADGREVGAQWPVHQRRTGGAALTERGYNGYSAPLLGRRLPKNMCFCETNPPFFYIIPYATSYVWEVYREKVREISVGSFWKTNPPGGCLWGVIYAF
jgi:hypothetical protein